MTKKNFVPTTTSEATESRSRNSMKRRSFLKGLGVTGAALSAGSMLVTAAQASPRSSITTVGDVAILRFLAAAEILETDLWQQYNELGGIQDAEVPRGSGSPAYAAA